MAKYVCSVCGYVYDEALGIPDAGIAKGTKWEDLPDNWTCPLCGATKAEFNKQEESDKTAEKKIITVIKEHSDMKELSAIEISAVCTNLARGCEKQYKPEEAKLFTELAQYYKKVAPVTESPSMDKLITLIEKDLEENLPYANAMAADAFDRGAMRALVWSEKVTKILKSLLLRYKKEGEGMLKGTGVYVCTICGFVFIGNTPPDLCPVCKVPNFKFEKIEEDMAV